jgi:hypothetical protein
MPHPNGLPTDSLDRLTLAQAARLTGSPKAYLRELAESGRLAVHLVPGAGSTKLRVSTASLIEAGLLCAESNSIDPYSADVGDLVRLVREQSARITALEEQRFQLGAQLGAALERVASLEERFEALEPHRELHDFNGAIEVSESKSALDAVTEVTSHAPARRFRDVAWQLTDAGFQRSARLTAGVLKRRDHLLGRTRRTPLAR